MTAKTFSKVVLVFMLALSTFSYYLLPAGSVTAATTENATVHTKNSDLTVRSGPGTDYKKVGSLKKGKSVTVYSRTKSGWSEIRYKDKRSYVSTKYLAFSPVKITKKKYKNISDLSYPQVSGLKSKTAQKKINQAFTKHAKEAYASYLEVKQADKKDKDEEWCNGKTCNYMYATQYKVKYNQDGKLSFLLYDYVYEGGAHGIGAVTAYNFKISSGKQIKIADILTSKQKYKKVQKYAYKYMSKHEDFFVDKPSDVPVNKHSQFYYAKDGIYLIFQEYEVAPYSSGNPSVKIPGSVYK